MTEKATDQGGWVWLLGGADDPHMTAVHRVLSRRGVEVLRTPSRERFRLVYRPGDLSGSLIDNRSLGRCRGAYVRRLPPRLRLEGPQERLGLDELYASQLEADAWRDTTWAALRMLHEEGRQVLNPPGSGLVTTNKLDVLRRAQAAGLRIPETLVTTSRPEGTGFVQEVEQAVAKPVRGGAYATLMLPGDERLGRLHRAPVTLQRRVFGPDVRVVLLDGEVLSAARLDGLFDGGVDFRADPAFARGDTHYTKVELDEDTTAGLRRLMAEMGARLCGVDLKLSDDGPVFLEANLAPAYLEHDRALSAGITRRIADALCR